jgi:hypothetical protein
MLIVSVQASIRTRKLPNASQTLLHSPQIFLLFQAIYSHLAVPNRTHLVHCTEIKIL